MAKECVNHLTTAALKGFTNILDCFVWKEVYEKHWWKSHCH